MQIVKPLALITGGASGIGLALAQEFARRGYDLLIVSRDRQRLDLAAQQINASTGANVDVLARDLTDRQATDDLRSYLAGTRRNVDVLVQSSGAFAAGPIAELSADDMAQLFAINVIAQQAVLRAVLPGMLASRSGRILNVGSLAGLSPTPRLAAYGASKAAVAAATQALRQELRGTGVTVSLLLPGLVRTDLVTRSTQSRVVGLAYRLATSPRTVAVCAYRGTLAGDAVIVPGLSARLLHYGMKLVPYGIKGRLFASIVGAASGSEAGTPAAGSPKLRTDVHGN